MKQFLLSALLLTFALCVCAQEHDHTHNHRHNSSDAHIFGHVINKQTDEHVAYMNVIVKGTSVATVTDASGHYFLNDLPAGTYTIAVYMVGYLSQEKQVTLEAGKGVELNFEVDEDAIMLNDVVISANKNETSRKEAPVVVGVISPKVFDNTNSVCLAEGLNFQPGLRLESNCQNCGFQQVRINGLEGAYSQILIYGPVLPRSLFAGVKFSL